MMNSANRLSMTTVQETRWEHCDSVFSTTMMSSCVDTSVDIRNKRRCLKKCNTWWLPWCVCLCVCVCVCVCKSLYILLFCFVLKELSMLRCFILLHSPHHLDSSFSIQCPNLLSINTYSTAVCRDVLLEGS